MTLQRKKPMRRTGGLKRSPMKRRNPERAARRRAEAFGEQAELCRELPCAVCWEPYKSPGKAARWVAAQGAGHGSDPHHEPTRAAGGKDRDTVPLCREHHDQRHRIGRQAFEKMHGVDLRAVAKAIHDEMEAARNVAQRLEKSE